MKKAPELSVEDRVRAVVYAKRHEDPAKRLSVSEVCREAGVNRANLYANHRELLDELLPRLREDAKQSKPELASPNVERNERRLEKVNRALLYLCLEMQLEVRSLRSRLPEKSRKKR